VSTRVVARRRQSEGRDRGPGGRARSAILLGPQRLQVTLGPVASEVAPDGKIATVTAGWQEREGEDEELDAELGGRSLNLRLYERFDRVSDEDPELARAHRETQDRLKLLRRAYNVRLSRLKDAWEAVGRLTGGPDVLEPEREAALDGIRQLDNHQLSRVREIREEFAERHAPAELPAVVRERAEIAAILEKVDAVVVAGGHVAVLLNRLNLFGLGDLLAGKILIALSGGAMVLSPRVVLFHDSPPQGPGHAEAFEDGLGLFPGIVALPYGSQRLRTDDRERSGCFARRFAPATCVLLDAGTHVEWRRRGWRAVGEALAIQPDGGLAPLRARSRAR